MRFAAHIGAGLAVFAAAACRPAAPLPEHLARIEGTVALPDTGRGDAYLFLYGSGDGPPISQAVPEYATAVPDVRLSRGDGRFVFAGVAPAAYRLWGFLDANRNFQPQLDVLAQPDEGDRPLGGVELTLSEGQELAQDVALGEPYRRPPPAFRVDTGQTLVELPDQPLVAVSLTLVADGLGVLGGGPPSFAVSLVDANGDGQPDVNSVGLPVLSPQLFLRFLPKPGQTVPLDSAGQPEEVIVPLLVNPAPFLLSLAGDLTREVVASSLQAFLVPQAQALVPTPGKAPTPMALSAIPVGDYELWSLDKSGQFWRVPNALGADTGQAVGGPFPSQAVRFRFVHGSTANL